MDDIFTHAAVETAEISQMFWCFELFSDNFDISSILTFSMKYIHLDTEVATALWNLMSVMRCTTKDCF